MWYWNRDNFVGLTQLAIALREDNRCAEIADYCSLRAQGLRKQALNSLRAFLEAFDAWPDAHRQEWAHGLMELQLAHPEVHQLIAHPLQETLIAIFEKWAETEPSNPSPCRWLGILTHSPEWFKNALTRDKGDEYSRWRAADSFIGRAEHACHHIPEYFIGEPADATKWLDDAEAVLAPIADTIRGRSAMKELNLARQKLDDWIGFQASDSDSFDEWCKQERGYTWKHPVVVYYEK